MTFDFFAVRRVSNGVWYICTQLEVSMTFGF